MVPIEIRAFALLAVCVILLAVVAAVQLLARPPGPSGRGLMLAVLVVVVIVAIYVWATTRMP